MGIGFVISQVQLSWTEFVSATEPPDVAMLAREEIPSIVTLDANGSQRVTQLWIAAVADRAYIRTGDSQWYQNLQRAPELTIRAAGRSHLCGTKVVKDLAESAAAHNAFRAKYPKRSAFFRTVGVSTNTVISLACGAGR